MIVGGNADAMTEQDSVNVNMYNDDTAATIIKLT